MVCRATREWASLKVATEIQAIRSGHGRSKRGMEGRREAFLSTLGFTLYRRPGVHGFLLH